MLQILSLPARKVNQMQFRLRKVDTFHDEDAERDIRFLDRLCFLATDAAIDMSFGSHWWLVENGRGQPVAFAGMMPSRTMKGWAYLSRAGVHPKFRGHGLQRRLLMARRGRARVMGYAGLLTDTSYDNIVSSNNLMDAGFRLFKPAEPWSFKDALYWRLSF
jgi:ribosomal protein S18 acetylase RimI-like enzyme